MSDKTRRKLFKIIASSSGAVIAGKSIPESWSRPVIDAVILPAHAQTSPPGVTGIIDLRLASTTLTIGGPSVAYEIDLNNATGATLSVVSVQAIIQQASASRAGGGFTVGFSTTCNGGAVGELPPGSCTQSFTLTASNTTGGSGTLVAGPATALFEMRDDGALVDQRTVDITLV
jgi:hypothetical protein